VGWRGYGSHTAALSQSTPKAQAELTLLPLLVCILDTCHLQWIACTSSSLVKSSNVIGLAAALQSAGWLERTSR
jgi:hypothetical protein